MTRPRQHGFSLLELAIVLAITGLIGLVAWRLLPASRSVAGGDPVGQQLRAAQDAVEGFALSRSRLPCPAPVGGDGNEACVTPGVAELPWRTLGLARGDSALRYGVYRSRAADPATARKTFLPFMPPNLTPPVGYQPNQINGLDLCQTLRTAAMAPLVSSAGLDGGTAPVAFGLDAGGVPVAFALAHPGANRHFDGANVGQSFALPGTPRTPDFDDRSVATGLGELSTRLGCVTRVADATARARSAYAAYDLDLNADSYLLFRNLVSTVRTTNKNLAASGLAIATADLAIAVGASASALSLAANSVGICTGPVVAAVFGVGAAIASEVIAAAKLALAVTAETLAQHQAAAAQALRTQSAIDYQAAFAIAATAYRKGLLP